MQLNLTAAALLAGVNRSTIARAVKSGRLSATKNEAGERCIDQAELLRVFGPFKGVVQAHPPAAPMQDQTVLVEVLRDQLRQSQEREVRLLAMLESEQSARRELEVKLLEGPKKKGKGKGKP